MLRGTRATPCRSILHARARGRAAADGGRAALDKPGVWWSWLAQVTSIGFGLPTAAWATLRVVHTPTGPATTTSLFCFWRGREPCSRWQTSDDGSAWRVVQAMSLERGQCTGGLLGSGVGLGACRSCVLVLLEEAVHAFRYRSILQDRNLKERLADPSIMGHARAWLTWWRWVVARTCLPC